MEAEAGEGEDEDGEGEEEEPADLAAALEALATVEETGSCGAHGCGLLGSLVDEVVDAELEVGAVECGGKRRELADAGDGAPGGTVQGVIVRGAIKAHGADMAVGKDGEAD